MAKNSVRQYDPVINNNQDIAGISLAEGVTKPSDVNNIDRTQMGQLAQYLAEMSYPTVGGTADALTLTPTTALAALANNVVYTGTIATTNATTTPTLNVSSLGAKVIRKISGGTDIAVAAGDMLAGAPTAFVYSTAANSSGGAWILINPASVANTDTRLIPTGSIVDYCGSSAPSGWLLCFGQAISRTTFAALFAAISTTYGVGDGSTTFNVPDLRGRVGAGADNMGGSAASRLTNSATGGVDGSALGNSGGEQAHTLGTTEMPSHSHTVTTGLTNDGTGIESQQKLTPGSGNTITSSSTGGGGAHNTVQPTLVVNKIIKT